VRRIVRKPAYGLNLTMGHRLRLPMQDRYWLVPGRHVLCLIYAQTKHEVSSSCAPTKVALRHGIVASSFREADGAAPAERVIVGVVPDGTRDAVVHTGKTTVTVAITRHIFVLKDSVSEPPDLVSLR
jgi:hypothetical protein